MAVPAGVLIALLEPGDGFFYSLILVALIGAPFVIVGLYESMPTTWTGMSRKVMACLAAIPLLWCDWFAAGKLAYFSFIASGGYVSV